MTAMARAGGLRGWLLRAAAAAVGGAVVWAVWLAYLRPSSVTALLSLVAFCR